MRTSSSSPSRCVDSGCRRYSFQDPAMFVVVRSIRQGSFCFIGTGPSRADPCMRSLTISRRTPESSKMASIANGTAKREWGRASHAFVVCELPQFVARLVDDLPCTATIQDPHAFHRVGVVRVCCDCGRWALCTGVSLIGLVCRSGRSPSLSTRSVCPRAKARWMPCGVVVLVEKSMSGIEIPSESCTNDSSCTPCRPPCSGCTRLMCFRRTRLGWWPWRSWMRDPAESGCEEAECAFVDGTGQVKANKGGTAWKESGGCARRWKKRVGNSRSGLWDRDRIERGQREGSRSEIGCGERDVCSSTASARTRLAKAPSGNTHNHCPNCRNDANQITLNSHNGPSPSFKSPPRQARCAQSSQNKSKDARPGSNPTHRSRPQKPSCSRGATHRL